MKTIKITLGESALMDLINKKTVKIRYVKNGSFEKPDLKIDLKLKLKEKSLHWGSE